ncbi:MAG: isoprenyl synthetase [Bacteroidetes bacterium GWF2_42_66]|nr:MAG: isoprenyl synthetase [Bacteroidetes bacterium GWA2_42_15]OFY01847.1 MAG: isoprenyl synthetase [Bacteroidetes bacterium GWE2_42_39]OFY44858.1 MAG: isoprenyl synthetase [Bacteroidetes bacterium GWF2_42_66]HBL75985.1 isoprenyl synthetase [Prolixibacteraceae bacterium]HCR89969.1 isoprenyl synthetase [Prolixibacteraceae bacterium]
MYTIQQLQTIIAEKIQKEADRIGATEPLNLYHPVSYTLNMGGKRLRPVMALLAYNMFRDDIEKAFPAALAIEIFHNFTLLHDDIMDCADMRRGQPVVHKKFSENAAILSGDAMSILAYQYILQTELPDIRQVTQLFSQTAIEICEGQQYDMDFETRMDVTIGEYLEMIRLKTAVLLACSLKAGALAAGADQPVADSLYEFGINLGMAFQLQDDLLDVFADEEKFGKTIGGDITTNKKTFLLLKALELAKEKTKQQLLGWITAKRFDISEKIDAVRKIYSELNIQQITQNEIEAFYKAAMKNLDELAVPQDRKNGLVSLSEMMMKRDH